jgi:hypothetical protein
VRQFCFSTKLYALMALLLAALLVVGVIGIVGIARTNAGLETVYQDRVIPLQQLKQIADAYAVSVIDAANKANAGLFTAEETLKALTGAREAIRQNWKAYRATSLTPEEARLSREAEQLFGPADKGVEQAIARLGGRTGSLKGEFGDFDGPLYSSVDPISNKITELVDLRRNRVPAEHPCVERGRRSRPSRRGRDGVRRRRRRGAHPGPARSAGRAGHRRPDRGVDRTSPGRNHQG